MKYVSTNVSMKLTTVVEISNILLLNTQDVFIKNFSIL